MRILIKNAFLVLEDRVELGDLLTDGRTIAQVGGVIDGPCDKVIDAKGCYVFPGFIDTHTHFDLEVGSTVTADNFVTGTKAAVVGGTTTVLDFATQERGMTLMEAFHKWENKAKNSSCNYGFHMAMSEWNDARIAEIPLMIENGVTSFKMYMVYDNMRLSDGVMYEAIKYLAKEDCIIGIHCENDDILKARVKELKAAGKTGSRYHAVSRPNIVEADGVGRLMDAAYLAGGPAWVVHLSTKEGLAIARRARERGQEVYLESCPQYLVLEEACTTLPTGLSSSCRRPSGRKMTRKPCSKPWQPERSTGSARTTAPSPWPRRRREGTTSPKPPTAAPASRTVRRSCIHGR